jgi:hypothetical protein
MRGISRFNDKIVDILKILVTYCSYKSIIEVLFEHGFQN